MLVKTVKILLKKTIDVMRPVPSVGAGKKVGATALWWVKTTVIANGTRSFQDIVLFLRKNERFCLWIRNFVVPLQSRFSGTCPKRLFN